MLILYYISTVVSTDEMAVPALITEYCHDVLCASLCGVHVIFPDSLGKVQEQFVPLVCSTVIALEGEKEEAVKLCIDWTTDQDILVPCRKASTTKFVLFFMIVVLLIVYFIGCYVLKPPTIIENASDTTHTTHTRHAKIELQEIVIVRDHDDPRCRIEDQIAIAKSDNDKKIIIMNP